MVCSLTYSAPNYPKRYLGSPGLSLLHTASLICFVYAALDVLVLQYEIWVTLSFSATSRRLSMFYFLLPVFTQFEVFGSMFAVALSSTRA